jgi:hypothetical protein
MQRLQRTFPALFLVAVLLAAWVFQPDAWARRDTETGFQRAVTTFATARALHAALSVAQGTQIAVEPGGVGAVFAPGQALAPLTELLEQFSTLMLGASVALGVQLLLLKIGAHWVVSAAVSLVVALWVLARWKDDGKDDGARRSSMSRRLAPLVVALLLVRFAVPVMALGSEAVYRVFLDQQYTEAKAEIAVPAGPETAASTQGDGSRSLLTILKGWVDQGKMTLDQARGGIQRMQQLASNAVDHLLRLLAVFVLQTLVLPLIFLWVLWRVLRSVVGSAFGGRMPA